MPGPVSTPIVPRITSAGLIAASNASANGTVISITHVAVGTGAYEPTGQETALLQRRVTAPIAGGGGIPGTAQHRIHTALQATGTDRFDISEVGFYLGHPDTGGVLFAVASRESPSYFEINSEFLLTASYTLGLAALPPGSVQVVVDQNYNAMLQLIGNHETAANPHPLYVRTNQIEAITLAILNRAYPVGSLFITRDGRNPSVILGFGSWARIKGRYIVGVDEADPNFASNNLLLGSATQTLTADQLTPHTHGINFQQLNSNGTNGSGRLATGNEGPEGTIPNIDTEVTGNGQPFSILPPSVTRYVWERIADGVELPDGVDTTPNTFNFVDQSSRPGLVYSNTITVSGINADTPASFTLPPGGGYIKNGVTSTAIDTVVRNGDFLQLFIDSAVTGVRSITVNLNGVTDTWSVNFMAAGNLVIDPANAMGQYQFPAGTMEGTSTITSVFTYDGAAPGNLTFEQISGDMGVFEVLNVTATTFDIRSTGTVTGGNSITLSGTFRVTAADALGITDQEVITVQHEYVVTP